jgi:hypothetical protein
MNSLQLSKVSTYTRGMRLLGLTLETIHFEDYLSFLTEVLELELAELSEDSMVLELQGTWLEIKKSSSAPKQSELLVRFITTHEEYESLVNKISFFYYRKGETSFLISSLDHENCSLTDPDGRQWCFSHSLTTNRTEAVAIM